MLYACAEAGQARGRGARRPGFGPRRRQARWRWGRESLGRLAEARGPSTKTSAFHAKRHFCFARKAAARAGRLAGWVGMPLAVVRASSGRDAHRDVAPSGAEDLSRASVVMARRSRAGQASELSLDAPRRESPAAAGPLAVSTPFRIRSCPLRRTGLDQATRSGPPWACRSAGGCRRGRAGRSRFRRSARSAPR
jgi:hypothetical protein